MEFVCFCFYIYRMLNVAPVLRNLHQSPMRHELMQLAVLSRGSQFVNAPLDCFKAAARDVNVMGW
jgi:hypothetical protein